jgi:SagB-type dehydrogenase family enzyme
MLFELALGLSAWKQYAGNRWALRCNPSSGNLHPTEGYAILPAMPGLAAGVYHYLSRDHVLERRCGLDGPAARQLAAALLPASCLVGLSSIHWREAWKYGERAFRYCQHDVGHAIAAVRYAAATLGWSARLIADVSDPTIAAMLGLTQSESVSAIAAADREHPDALLLVGPFAPPAHGEEAARVDLATMGAVLQAGTWTGRANPLSPAHVPWPAIDAAAEATWRADGAGAPWCRGDAAPSDRAALGSAPSDGPAPPNAVQLIKQRRSCLALDGTTEMEAARFYAILDRLLPRLGAPPWDVWPWPAHLHCGIFVHRVRGVPPGLYLLERNPAAHARLQAALGADFSWTRPDGCPEALPLFALAAGDFREVAQAVSCHQQIAGGSAFRPPPPAASWWHAAQALPVSTA